MARILLVVDVELNKDSWFLRQKFIELYLAMILEFQEKPKGLNTRETNMRGCRLVVETKGDLEKLIESYEKQLPSEYDSNIVDLKVQSESSYATIFFVYQPVKLFDFFPISENIMKMIN